MTEPTFDATLAHPLYNDLRMFVRPFGRLQAWEFDGWKPESMSWKTGCYIHAGLSGPAQFTFTGRQAADFLSSICINDFSRFPDGTAKHAIMLTDEGLVAAHALVQRDAEDRYRMFAVPPWALYQATRSQFDVQFAVDDIYLFQIAGPTSLQTLERATGENLHDVGFLGFRPTSVDGKATEICRIGMSGTLAYELRGPIAEGPEVYDAVLRAGADLGIQRLGWRTYMVNHVEGGFPQLAWTFMFAANEDPGYAQFAPAHDVAMLVSGSVDPSDMRARYRTPVELGLAPRGSLRPRLHRARGTRGGGCRPQADDRHAAVEPGGRHRHLRLPAPSGRGVQDAGPPHAPALARRPCPRRSRPEGRGPGRRLLGHDLQLLLPRGHLACRDRSRDWRRSAPRSPSGGATSAPPSRTSARPSPATRTSIWSPIRPTT